MAEKTPLNAAVLNQDENSASPQFSTTEVNDGFRQWAAYSTANHYYPPWPLQQNPFTFSTMPCHHYWNPSRMQLSSRNMTVIERSVVYNFGNFLVYDFERECYYNEYHEYSTNLNPYTPYYQH